MMFLTVALCFIFGVSNAFAQLTVVGLPPSVDFINSDYNQTVHGFPGAVIGHYDYLKGNNVHFTAYTPGAANSETWEVRNSTFINSYIVIFTEECLLTHLALSDIKCVEWSQDVSGLWKRSCKETLSSGTEITEVTMKVVNGQPAWLDEVLSMGNKQLTTHLRFATTSAQAPPSGMLIPPALCLH